MKTGFVTDSTSDIPAPLAEQYGIEIVPVLVNIAGKSYADGLEISREEFYTRLPGLRSLPTTSSPSVGSFQERYEKLFKAGADSVISIHPPNALSGIYNAARLAAQEFGQRVTVVDSGQLSLGLGYQVILAAEAAAQGARREAVLSVVESVHKRVRLTALLETIEYVRRSGRVSWAAAMLGGVFRLQPLIGLRYGIVHRLGLARTRLQGIERLVGNAQFLGTTGTSGGIAYQCRSGCLAIIGTCQVKGGGSPFAGQCHHCHRDACWPEWAGLCGSAGFINPAK